MAVERKLAAARGAFPFELLDLTQQVSPAGPVWPGDPETERNPAASHEEQGYALGSWRLGEHSGTHLGAPSHFLPGGEPLEQSLRGRFVWPLRVWRGAAGPGTVIGIDDVQRFERETGSLEQGQALLLDTGWAERWPEAERLFERDERGRLLHPGLDDEAARWIVEERGLRLIGTDAPGVDAGPDCDFRAGTRLARAGGLHLENLSSLAALPEHGAWLLLAPLPLADATGAPCRAFALLTKDR